MDAVGALILRNDFDLSGKMEASEKKQDNMASSETHRRRSDGLMKFVGKLLNRRKTPHSQLSESGVQAVQLQKMQMNEDGKSSVFSKEFKIDVGVSEVMNDPKLVSTVNKSDIVWSPGTRQRSTDRRPGMYPLCRIDDRMT
eukprot:CAMPEP_0113858134 /NCGR_PEP_ID=MMETSP0372-20130328/10957_1 /TAXON_ID=340204 /ORGANISM="Lankesteria abbotti" /LENGTH=140 /DNA_ID=CAMNT_0000834881 /DNA_START=263 /DNA_END=681 /DNA_ORIENTATION=+ /assembly_acc=CAM_ASM_000359